MGENLGYTLIQIAHNFGAVAVLGGAVGGRWLARRGQAVSRGIAWLVLAGWIVQAASGSAFGLASYSFYGRLPDIHGIAVAALVVKIACAVTGIVVTAACLKLEPGRTGRRSKLAWTTLTALAATALTAAAFLRWFS